METQIAEPAVVGRSALGQLAGFADAAKDADALPRVATLPTRVLVVVRARLVEHRLAVVGRIICGFCHGSLPRRGTDLQGVLQILVGPCDKGPAPIAQYDIGRILSTPAQVALKFDGFLKAG